MTEPKAESGSEHATLSLLEISTAREVRPARRSERCPTPLLECEPSTASSPQAARARGRTNIRFFFQIETDAAPSFPQCSAENLVDLTGRINCSEYLEREIGLEQVDDGYSVRLYGVWAQLRLLASKRGEAEARPSPNPLHEVRLVPADPVLVAFEVLGPKHEMGSSETRHLEPLVEEFREAMGDVPELSYRSVNEVIQSLGYDPLTLPLKTALAIEEHLHGSGILLLEPEGRLDYVREIVEEHLVRLEDAS